MNAIHRWYCSSDRWRRAVGEKLLPWVLRGAELGDDVLEIGPGPGITTDVLRARVPRLTSVEVDRRLAAALRARLWDTNVRVLHGDATRLELPDASFSGAIACTMLHHVPSPRWWMPAAEVPRAGPAGPSSAPTLTSPAVPARTCASRRARRPARPWRA
jgi:SAM-dependent methyltransferase